MGRLQDYLAVLNEERGKPLAAAELDTAALARRLPDAALGVSVQRALEQPDQSEDREREDEQTSHGPLL